MRDALADATKLEGPTGSLANKFTRLTSISRGQALDDLLEEARLGNIEIRSDEGAQVYLDWAARVQGVDPSNINAVTLGDLILVRPEYVENVRVLREELIHVFQQRAGMVSADRVQYEIEARLEIIKFRYKWSITNDEVKEMIADIRQMRKTGRY